ncbi:MAG: ROK family glucokinase [Lachnospiraceae bacterium]|nr:ROK family glucokinase [Lachnospiraceae bacterium]
MANYCYGVDIGGTTVKMGLFDQADNLLEKWEITTDTSNNGANILKDIFKAIEDKNKEKNINIEDITGVGIGVPGPVLEDGTVLKCVNLGWDVFNVAGEFEEISGIHNIKIGNDANVAALGEMYRGGGKGYNNIVMITLGTGVGGGIILNGNILTGSNGAAGELGHIKVRTDEEDSCGCGGKGCLEQYASATGIVKEAKRLLAKDSRDSKLRTVDNLDAKAIFDLAKEGDTLAYELVEQLGRYLGMSCANIAAVVDPEAFVIGGGVSKAGNILIDLIKKYYEQYAMPALKGKEFKIAELGNDAGIYGCVRMV